MPNQAMHYSTRGAYAALRPHLAPSRSALVFFNNNVVFFGRGLACVTTAQFEQEFSVNLLPHWHAR